MSKKFWGTNNSINQFKNKKRIDFFKSEKFLHEKIKSKIKTILDVGCASGRLIELLNFYYEEFDFLGIDIVESQVKQARENYPSHKFLCTDIFTLDNLKKYDLINATGVFQHEKKYKNLLSFLWRKTSKYLLFDVKFLDCEKDLNDITKAFCDIDHNQIPFIMISPKKFFKILEKLEDVNSISLIAYETKKNNITTLPSNVKNIVSAGILLEKKHSQAIHSNSFTNYDGSLLVGKIKSVFEKFFIE